MPSPAAAPSLRRQTALTLAPGTSDSPTAEAAAVLLGALEQLLRGFEADWHEGPGAMVDPELWARACRRLADDLLADAADAEGRVALPSLAVGPALVAHRLYGPRAVEPLEPSAPWDGQLLVVLGCGRSGTTWLERLLMASPEAGGVDGAESFLFKLCSPLWGVVHRTGAVCDEARLTASLRRFCDTIFSAALRAHTPDATTFVEKTPLHSLIVGQLRAVYPDAVYLHLVRDGRDVARSISQVPFFELPDPAEAARLWHVVLHQVRAQAPTLTRFRELRYEQLLQDPVAGVADVLSWAGLAVDDNVLSELEKRSAVRVSTHAGTAHTVGAGSWSALPSRDLARVLAECGELLVAEGYLTRRGLRRGQLHPAYWRRRLRRALRD